ncbi:suppressor of fused domain protein [Brevibacillus borstelensis]|uniref:suppressor of fused domain protein n=1 Tax=Brevibacillus borstelensis TaxID=45462 RepID=UPI001D0AC99B|nr:suppressor of fused domain protein [Brevibacillus borstelensis]MCC0562974.1 suppressor of fused domain protein [Brevibacillus borstelensis]MED1872198.1 suppressor of fused domain protein [Brevibacillus borstelensis]WNF06747.1 Suppressor of fused protein (SUFU) [Brevibacillus borstelensis]
MLVARQLYDHCSRLFGSDGELYYTEKADTLLAVFPPTRERGWWTYTTLELHRSGGIECMLYSYHFDGAFISHLGRVAAEVARRWEETGRGLANGDVFALGKPIQKGSSLQFVLATPADFEVEGFDLFTNGSDVVWFKMLHAISGSEAEFLSREGLAALERQFADAEVNSLDVMRPPVM